MSVAFKKRAREVSCICDRAIPGRKPPQPMKQEDAGFPTSIPRGQEAAWMGGIQGLACDETTNAKSAWEKYLVDVGKGEKNGK